MAVQLISPMPTSRSAPVWGIAAWLAAASVAGAAGLFAPDGTPPIALGIAAGGPPLLAVGLGIWSPRFRARVRSLDLRLLTQLQMWRIAGFVFIVLAGQRLLPAGFALPAGIGDVFIGMTAPVVAAALLQHRRAYLAWTALGIADLLIAVTLGTLHSHTPIGVLATSIDTDMLGQLPMSLIPTFGVPLCLVLHVLAVINLGGRPDTSHA
ncbi:hypothetical protein [Lentzea nigeriaca]|uniref:hypothetical protein n=1 Tax=Lentzea nigeriaca TaxID=1128665 RepID=UPI0019590CAB|nr:hypothetical protein [Lentzea nigeriaca]MBM7860905.1 hypothetical protein [Lentzea nigeriaca]